jgi:hypothetical protein
MKTVESCHGWRCRAAPVGLYVYDVNGDKIGTIDVLYYVDDAGPPEWMSIRTGFFRLNACFAPMVGSIRDGKLHLPFTKAQVKDAPKLALNGYVTTETWRELFDHFGINQTDC